MSDTTASFEDGAEILYREYYQKSGVYVRLVKATTNRVTWKSVGYTTYSAAQSAAATTAAIAGNHDVRVVPVGGGLFNVTWTHGTVTKVYGPWTIPVTPTSNS